MVFGATTLGRLENSMRKYWVLKYTMQPQTVDGSAIRMAFSDSPSLRAHLKISTIVVGLDLL